MAEQEADIIGHLLEIERSASTVLSHAQEEAEKRISVAKTQADQEFKAQYDKIVADEEQRFAAETASVTKKYDDDVAAYKERISGAAKDTSSFNKLLDKVLFAS